MSEPSAMSLRQRSKFCLSYLTLCLGAASLIGGGCAAENASGVGSARSVAAFSKDSQGQPSDANDGTGPSVTEETSRNHTKVEEVTTNPQVTAVQAETADAEPAPDAAAAFEAAPLAPLPEGTKVLHVGDSFAGALGYRLNAQLKEQGVRGVLKYQKSTYIPTWAWGKELSQHLARYQPDLVLVTLGGNELKIPDPNKRASTVKRLVGRLGGRPCVWVGIPLWDGANPALMQVIRDNVSPCLFLDSTALMPDMERAGDKIHPSEAAREKWAKAVVKWLQEHRDPAGDEPWSWRKAGD